MQKEEAYYKSQLSRFIGNELSLEEVYELLEFIQSQPAWYNRLLNNPEIKNKLSEQAYNTNVDITDVVSARMKERLLAAVRENEAGDTVPTEQQTDHPNRKHLFRLLNNNWRWAVAAVIVIAITTAVVLSVDRPSKGPGTDIAETTTNDVLPGGDRATLKLANGQLIILDSAANGSLAIQGNAKIIKLANGQIVYTVENKVNTELLYNTMSTPHGGQYKLKLPDGTDVWLNAASSITYPTVFAEKDRKVTITGEVYFEVAKDKSKPFHVKVNAMDVEVLGTHFNINSYEGEADIKTTLLEGSVKVSIGTNSSVLKAGQQAIAISFDRQNGNAESILVKNDINLDQVMAWKNGMFNFSKVSLEEVMKQIARWYDVEIEYQGAIKPKQFGGEIQRDLNLSEVLEGLNDAGVHFRIEGKKLIVLP